RSFGLTGVAASSSGRDQRLLPAYDQLLEIYMPTGVLVDEHYELLHTFGELGDVLRWPRGRASTHLLDLLDSNIRTAVSGALHRAAKSEQAVSYSGLVVV